MSSTEHWTSLADSSAEKLQAKLEKAVAPICSDGKANNLDDVLEATTEISAVLKHVINPMKPGQGIDSLLEKDSALSKLKLADKFEVDAFAKALTAKLKAAGSSPSDGNIRQEARKMMEDARANHQVNIGYKTAIGAACGTIFGTALVNEILLDDITQRPKSLDDWQPSDIIAHVKQAALHPSDGNRLKTKTAFLAKTRIDFRRPVSTEFGKIDNIARKLNTRGMAITAHDKGLVVRSQMEWASKQPWATLALSNAPTDVKNKVAYDATIDDTLYTEICDMYIKADKGRDYAKAPAPPPPESEANIVGDLCNAWGRILEDTDDASVADTASHKSDRRKSRKPSKARKASKPTYYSSSSDEDSEASTRRRERERKQRKKQRQRRERDRGNSRTRGDDDDVTCPHCIRFGQKKPHPHLTPKECTFNPNNWLDAKPWAKPIIKRVLKAEKDQASGSESDTSGSEMSFVTA